MWITPRGRHQAELDALIDEWTRTKTIAELEELTTLHSIPAGRIFKPADMIADPHFQAREAIVEVAHPKFDKLQMQNIFPKLSATPGSIRSIAPQTVGADNDAVLGGIGIDAEGRDQLRAGGVI